MHTIESKYLGNLRTENKHLKSGAIITTDAPTDNNGKGEAFSPTDLLGTALCDCILTINGMTAAAQGFSIDGASAKVTKVMSEEKPRRIAEIIIEFDFSMCNLTEKQQTIVQRAEKLCPVGLSLHPDIKQNISYIF